MLLPSLAHQRVEMTQETESLMLQLSLVFCLSFFQPIFSSLDLNWKELILQQTKVEYIQGILSFSLCQDITPCLVTYVTWFEAKGVRHLKIVNKGIVCFLPNSFHLFSTLFVLALKIIVISIELWT